MSTLTITIAGTAVPVKESSLKISGKIDQRTTCTFSVMDANGAYAFSKGQPVVVSDSVLGTLFTGYINKPKAINYYPSAYLQWDVDCVDQMWLADKRTSNSIYGNQQAAVILCDQLENIVSAEGVTGAYALDYNHFLTDWTAGSSTLNNVVAAMTSGDGNVGDGDLELARSGIPLQYTDNLAQGTFSTVQLVNGQLGLASTQGVRMLGTAAQSNSGGSQVNAYVYYKIWNGGSLSIASGDQLVYDVWIASTSPKQEAGVDMVCNDGTTLRDFLPAITDQNGIGAHPSNDLSGFAGDTWYTRFFDLSPLNGKTISYVSLGLEGDNPGTYTAYFRKVKLLDGSGHLKQPFFINTLQNNQIISSNCYVNMSLLQCTVYELAGTRQAPAISLNTLGLPQTSSIAWVQPPLVSSLAPTVPITGSSKVPTLTVQTSIDNGATWQSCTNYGAIPNILPGMSMGGRSLLLRQVFALVGPDPTITPLLTGCVVNIEPSYNATKTDVIQTEATQSQWNAGTLTNVQANSNGTLTLVQASRDWHLVSQLYLSDQTQFSAGGVPSTQTQFGNLQLSCNGSNDDCRSRFDFAGSTWNNFTAAIDINLGTPVVALAYGLEYRTTFWGNDLNSYAWWAYFIFTNVSGAGTLNLAKGTNASGGGVINIVQSVNVTLSSGSIHRIKVIANGSNHQVFLDDIPYINITDSSYSGNSGYLAAHFFNNSSVRHSGDFSFFGVCKNLSGTYTTPVQSLAAAGLYEGSVIQWNDILDTSGASALVVQTSVDGGTTYQPCTNGGAIPNLTLGQSLSAVNLRTQLLLSATDPNATPTVSGLTAWVLGTFSATGVWQNTPLVNDTFVRANQSGFGTSFDGQAYTQVGTGTAAIVSNEGQISATTGDVEMVAGSNTGGDEDGSVRFSLSTATMEAGMELRRVDGNNWYRLYATGTQLVLVQNVAGVQTTLASATLTLSTGLYYRMRFRIVSSGPATVTGRVWLDGSPEPTSWGVAYVG